MMFRFVQAVQSRSFSFSPQFWNRFPRAKLRERLSRNEPKHQDVPSQSYYSDAIPVRPYSHLWKAAGFTVGVTAVTFTVAAMWEAHSRNQITFKPYDVKALLREFVTDGRRKSGPFVPFDEMSEGSRCALALIAVNSLVWIAWRLPYPRLNNAMLRYFTNSYASRSLVAPMLLSVFSHSQLVHLGLNMYVLYSFTPVTIDHFLGTEQFLALFATAGVVSSFTSLAHKAVIRSNIRALGASGAILAVLTYVCTKMPDARLQIIFLPFFDFSAEHAALGIIFFDLCGLIFRIRFGFMFWQLLLSLFDHAAHLGGAIFGILYAKYGEKYYHKLVDYFQRRTPS